MTSSHILPEAWRAVFFGGLSSPEAKAEASEYLIAHNLPLPVGVSEESWFALDNDFAQQSGNVTEFYFITKKQ